MCLPEDDFLQKCDLRGTRAMLYQLKVLMQEPIDLALPGFECQICDLRFTSAASLSKRMSSHHQVQDVQVHVFRYDRDSLDGHPTCNHCKSQFCETWELQRHINRHACRCHDPLADQVGTLRQDEQYIGGSSDWSGPRDSSGDG